MKCYSHLLSIKSVVNLFYIKFKQKLEIYDYWIKIMFDLYKVL